jgi:hypothetical protein
MIADEQRLAADLSGIEIAARQTLKSSSPPRARSRFILATAAVSRGAR